MRTDPALTAYANSCRTLFLDIRTLVADLRFEQEGHGTVVYAVDFSEVYSYVYADQSFESMRLFSDDGADVMAAAQHASLNTLFFNLSHHLVLLMPYAVELKSFVRNFQDRRADDLISRIAQAEREIVALSRSEQFQKVAAAFAAVETQGALVDPDLLQHAVQYLEREAGHLLALLADSDRAAADRLRALLKANKFPRSDEFLLERNHLDPEVIDRWHSALLASRAGGGRARDGSSYLDALAIAHLYAMLVKPDSTTRLRLVTRSSHMHALYQQERNAGLWPGSETLLLHPRCFAFLTPGQSYDETMGRLEKLTKTLENFLLTHGETAGAAVRPFKKLETMASALRAEGYKPALERAQDDVAAIKLEWRSRIELTSSLFGTGTQSEQVMSQPSPRARVERVLELVRDQELVRTLVRERIDVLLEDMRVRHHYLGLVVPEAATEDAARYEKRADEAVLSSPLYWMPYTLQFYSKEISDHIQRSSGAALEAMLQFLRDYHGGATNYERLLSMAFLWGMRHRWGAAKRYCEEALAFAGAERTIPEHEALFFLAVCLRKTATAAEHYERSLDLLDQAATCKQRVRPAEGPDPRYLKEKAAVIFEWILKHRNGSITEIEPPPERKALDYSGEAWHHAGDDVRLKTQILNNLCFYMLEGQPRGWRHRARDYHDQLIATQNEVEPDRNQWPPNYVDTILWAQFKLEPEGDLKKLTAAFEQLLRRTAKTEADNVRDHLGAVRRAARRRRPRS